MSELRAHQKAMLNVVSEIRHYTDVDTIIASVTAGGGKSSLPVIMAAQLIPHDIDRICWVVPRTALAYQAEDAFTDPVFREALDHKHLLRTTTSADDPCRGLTGFATTYQALRTLAPQLIEEFSRHRYGIVLDEFQFCSEDGSFTQSVAALVKLAQIRLFMSGTIERGRKNEKIAFMDYEETLKSFRLNLEDTETQRVITYSRSQALGEKALIPLDVTYIDASAEWERNGIEGKVSVDSLRDLKIPEAKTALFTALNTEYANELLDQCVDSWRKTRKINPRAKLLVVAGSQKLARNYCKRLRSMAISTSLAIVSEGSGAMRAIRAFKRTDGEASAALVTVGQAYIGLDVKPITHIACLTRIRSKPWLEQMIARAMRYDHDAGPWEGQKAHVFVPDDPMMHGVLSVIEAECKGLTINKAKPKEKADETAREDLFERDLFGELIPIGSKAAGSWSRPMAAKIITPSDREKALRDEIEERVRYYAGRNGVQVKDVNSHIKKAFGKSRTIMRLDELSKVREWALVNLV